jgi:O-antigen/teichoic acid export membrane protein
MKRLYLAIINKFFRNKLEAEDSLIFYNGISKSIIVQGFSFFFIFISSVIMVRLAGIPEYGIYVNIFNWINLLTVISCFGMEDVVLALIPVELKKNNARAIISIVTRANKTILIVSLISSLLFIAIVFSGLVPSFNEYKNLWLLALVNIYLGSFIIVNQQTLQAFNRFYVSQAIDKILKPSLLVLLLSTFWFSRKNIDARTLIIFNITVLTICCVVLLLFVRSTLNKLPKQARDVEKPPIFGANLYFVLISVFVLLKSRIIMMILGTMNQTEDVGILNIAYRLADFVLLPYMLIHAVVPQLFSSHKHSEVGYRKKLFQKSNQLILIGALPIMLFFVAFGKLVLKLYDPALQQYYTILLILCGSQFLYSVFGPCTALLMMQGKQKQAAWAMLLDIAINSLLFFAFIEWLGLMGAAVASFLGSLCYNILLRILVNRNLNATNT